ncbi:MAG: glycosyltransferase [Flavobacteriales bacterium]|nr:glycosyltransferase [Flavobacteriales bacterium]
MSDQPVSVQVAVITYNHEDTIAQCLNSILSQECQFPVHIVIGEDCSQDKTFEICKTFKSNYPDQITLLDNSRNLGIAQNFARSLVYGSSKYVAICEGDDYWTLPTKLRKQIELLECTPDASLCWSLNSDVNEETEKFSLSGKDRPIHIELPYLLEHGWFIRTATIVYRREHLENFPDWFFSSFSTDYILQLLLASKGSLIKLEEDTAVYRRHTGGITSGNWDHWINRLENKLKLLNKIDEFYSYNYKDKIKTQKNNIVEELFFTLWFRQNQYRWKTKFKRSLQLLNISLLIRSIVQIKRRVILKAGL